MSFLDVIASAVFDEDHDDMVIVKVCDILAFVVVVNETLAAFQCCNDETDVLHRTLSSSRIASTTWSLSSARFSHFLKLLDLFSLSLRDIAPAWMSRFVFVLGVEILGCRCTWATFRREKSSDSANSRGSWRSSLEGFKVVSSK